MRTPLVLLSFVLLLGCSAFGQQPSQPSTPSNVTNEIVAKIAAGFSNTPIESIHLSGQATVIAGPIRQSGSFDFVLHNSGDSRLQIEAGPATRTEVTSLVNGHPSCTWAGNDSVTHKLDDYNCGFSLNWVLPAMSVHSSSDKLTASRSTSIDAKTEIAQVDLSRISPDADSDTTEKITEKLSRVSLVLDQSANPKEVAFYLHPENDSSARPVSLLC